MPLRILNTDRSSLKAVAVTAERLRAIETKAEADADKAERQIVDLEATTVLVMLHWLGIEPCCSRHA